MAAAQRFRTFDTRTVPFGTTRSASRTRSELWVTKRPNGDLRKLAKEKPEPISGWYQGPAQAATEVGGPHSRPQTQPVGQVVLVTRPGSEMERLSPAVLIEIDGQSKISR